MTKRRNDSLRPVQIVRYSLWAAVLIAILGIGFYAFETQKQSASAIGGPFTLTDQNGERVSEDSLVGHPSAMFFGYTYCPDVCPTTLLAATNWLKALGPDGDKLKIYFVTVDPERDTQEQMQAYLGAFDPRIVGLTGARPAVDAMLKEYRVYSKKVGEGEDYAMDHTAAVYLLNDEGKFVGTADYQEPEADVLAKLKRLIAG